MPGLGDAGDRQFGTGKSRLDAQLAGQRVDGSLLLLA